MKIQLTFNNFAKFYLCLSVYGLGMQGGLMAYIIAAHMLWWMFKLALVIYPITYISFYLLFKTLTTFFPKKTGERDDAVAMVEAAEDDLKKIWSFVKSLCPHTRKEEKKRKKNLEAFNRAARIPEGTKFPEKAKIGDLFFRTDHDKLFKRYKNRWRSVVKKK